MESVHGGEKKSEGLTQNISQVRTILIRIDPEHQAVESLLSRENVRNKWLTPFKKDYFQVRNVPEDQALLGHTAICFGCLLTSLFHQK